MWYELDKLVLGVHPFAHAIEPVAEVVLRKLDPRLSTKALRQRQWRAIEWIVQHYLQQRFLLDIPGFDRRDNEYEHIYHLIKDAYGEDECMERDFFRCIDHSISMRNLPERMFVRYIGSAVCLFKKN